MKIDTISLFSGGGGLDLGFIESGFNIVYAIDNDKAAVDSYKENIDSNIILDDIFKIDLSTLPEARVVIGGPPCQSFSLVGKRDINDSRSDLVWRYLEIIKHVQPEYFVFENVIGLKSAKTPKGTKVLDDLAYAFQNIGYSINIETLNSADFGVPQRRKRVIIVGNNKGQQFEFPTPTHNEEGTNGLKKWVSSEDAIGDLGPANVDGNTGYISSPQSEYQKKMRDNSQNSEVTQHYYPQMSELDKQIISFVKPGGNYMDVPDFVPSNRIKKFKETGGRTTCYGRLLPSKPSYTINTHFNRPNVGCNIHYSEDRLITVREAMRFQSFPDSYRVVSKTKRGLHTVVGNAVPPLLAQIIARKIKKYIL
ncbi:DNA cytosine methyltransferase [Streptococcus thermophilus]|nr:DNA (cytosine-5-)-methyltransferase [Streptococcus thermophilus]MCE2100039.1 DNA (cytosine-5-)-methyltransferase [Streptococcus thermophilus]